MILTFFHIFINLKKNDGICQNCNELNRVDSKSLYRSTDTLFKDIKVMSNDDTLNEIINHKKSIARFGDGEFEIIFGKGIGFQKFSLDLRNKLLNVLHSNHKNLLIGIMKLKNIRTKFWYNWINKNKFKLEKIIDKNKIYYSSMITRFYDINRNKVIIKNYIKKFKSIWNNRNILIIEGEKTRMGIGNDLFNNSKSIKRIICPSINAFDVYEQIIESFKKLKIDKKILILIALGPTATIISYDLTKLGYQILDFGHFDIQYELYLRNATKIIKIPNKYVNEVPGGSANITPVSDRNYYKQIIYIIK